MAHTRGMSAITVGLSALGLVSACRADPRPSADQQSLVSAFGGDREQACTYVSSMKTPYVVGWDEIKLNDLQRAIDRGRPVAVKSTGCTLEILKRCSSKRGTYRFSRAAMSRPQSVELRSASEAIAEFQLGGIGLESYFDSYGELQVTRALGGTWEVVDATDMFVDDLEGTRCDQATHVVAAVDVGAYRVEGLQAKAGGAKVRGGVGPASAGIGAGGSSSRAELSERGEPEVCDQSWGNAPAPACSTPLRLTLQELRPAAERASRCPYGMQHISGGRLGELPLLDFCLDRTEVTVDRYRACVDAGRCRAPARSRFGTWRDPNRSAHPVTDVSWHDAVDYCEHAGKRLPTAEEWQWAAQGRDQERPYPWGTLPPTSDLACYGRAYGRLGTCPAGEHELGASSDGVIDLAGNVWEWTATPFEGNERRRVLMGGSWRDDDPDRLRTGKRQGQRARHQGDGDVGFRCAAAVRPVEPAAGPEI